MVLEVPPVDFAMNPRETSPAQKLSIPNSWFTLEKYVKHQVKWMI